MKIKLLSLGIFEDNHYFNQYIELIKDNINTIYVKGKIERHHIIPRCYYKSKNIDIDNSSENLVNLNHFDHCLAHYYLCLCLKGQLKYKNEHAFIKMVNIKSRFEFDFEKFLTKAPLYNDLYNNFIEQQSIRAKKLYSGKGNLKGKRYFTNGKIKIYAKTCPPGFWLAKGNNFGKRINEETRERMKLAAKKRSADQEYRKKMSANKNTYYKNHVGVTANRKWITNGLSEKLVNLNDYILEEGWYIGRSNQSKIKNQKNIKKGREIKNENQKTM